ncbi:hypothetical protein GF336_01885 [Candidatus Woesearchaeota archaeon]|nr:hypothetical protein [Candidatus Woesearchaeota archaeon]
MIEKILKEKKARKIFGKREIEIILNQIKGGKLSQSEKNVLSRDIRPKLKFIKELSRCSDEFELKHNQQNKKIIDKAVEEILENPLKEKVKAILLFGSFADNSFIWRSDIDICVLFDEISSKEAFDFRAKVMGGLPDKLDIQVFNELPQKIKKSIAKNHRVLFKRTDFDNLDFSLRYIKDDDYFIRMENIFGESA